MGVSGGVTFDFLSIAPVKSVCRRADLDALEYGLVSSVRISLLLILDDAGAVRTAPYQVVVLVAVIVNETQIRFPPVKSVILDRVADAHFHILATLVLFRLTFRQ